MATIQISAAAVTTTWQNNGATEEIRLDAFELGACPFTETGEDLKVAKTAHIKLETGETIKIPVGQVEMHWVSMNDANESMKIDPTFLETAGVPIDNSGDDMEMQPIVTVTI